VASHGLRFSSGQAGIRWESFDFRRWNSSPVFAPVQFSVADRFRAILEHRETEARNIRVMLPGDVLPR
jgi:hypothetical protein